MYFLPKRPGAVILPGYLRVRFESGFVAGRQVLGLFGSVCVCVGWREQREGAWLRPLIEGCLTPLEFSHVREVSRSLVQRNGSGAPPVTLDRQLELGAGTLAAWFCHKNHLATLFQPEGTPCYRDPGQVAGPSKPIPPFSLSRVYEAGVQLLHTK